MTAVQTHLLRHKVQAHATAGGRPGAHISRYPDASAPVDSLDINQICQANADDHPRPSHQLNHAKKLQPRYLLPTSKSHPAAAPSALPTSPQPLTQVAVEVPVNEDATIGGFSARDVLRRAAPQRVTVLADLAIHRRKTILRRLNLARVHLLQRPAFPTQRQQPTSDRRLGYAVLPTAGSTKPVTRWQPR